MLWRGQTLNRTDGFYALIGAEAWLLAYVTPTGDREGSVRGGGCVGEARSLGTLPEGNV